jgi:putative DNA primase/helicase
VNVETIWRARGRWQEILTQLGVDPRYLRNKHGPCPICGGRDRYRFDDKEGSGSYFCSQCGAGTGFALACKLLKCDRSAACEAIEKIIGPSPRREPREERAEDTEQAKRRTAVEKIMREANAPDVVEGYLASRGISATSPVLLGHRACACTDSADIYTGRYPAVIAPIVAPDGSLQSVHRTYIGDVSPRKKIMPPVDTIRGGAVRLHEPTNVLGVAEGIETALAASELFGVPVWAAISATGLEAFEPPKCLQQLHILSDNDTSFTGQKAAYTLANRLSRERSEMACEVHVPPLAGTDYNDVLRGRK